MGSNQINKAQLSRGIQTEVQTIAGEIAQTSISQGRYQRLFKKLDSALAQLQGLESGDRSADVFARAQAEHLREQVVKLYGDLENGLLKREISQIREESTSLRKGRLTLQAIKKLETHISELEKNHLAPLPDRRVIADAKQALLEARGKLEGKPVARHIDYLAKQIDVRFVEENALLPGEIEELFSIARSVYNRDFRQAKADYNSLPEHLRRRCQKHLQNLMAKAFEDPLETMQALIATANDLVGNGEGYPGSDEIDQLFLGLSQLTIGERAGGNIFSLKSKESFGE